MTVSSAAALLEIMPNQPNQTNQPKERIVRNRVSGGPGPRTSCPGRRSLKRSMLLLALLFATLLPVWTMRCFSAPQNEETPTPTKKRISGLIKSGDVPLPGVAVSATDLATGQQAITSTDENGTYTLTVSSTGKYKVNAQLAAFAPGTQELTIDESHTNVRADFQLILQSRVQTASQKRLIPREAQMARGGRNGPGFLSLPVTEGEANLGGVASADEPGSTEAASGISPAGVAPESVTISGAAPTMAAGGNPNFLEFRQLGIQIPGQPGGPGGGAGGFAVAGGPGGAFGNGGGFGGGGPIMGPFGGGGRGGAGRGNFNRIRGNVSETLQVSALDASPFSLTGQPIPKPSYTKNHYSIAVGGPLNIPKVYHGGTSTFFFFSYDGNRGQNAYTAFSTVPTAAERAGDFSGLQLLKGPNVGSLVQIFDPRTGMAFAGNVIPSFRISPSAASLMQYLPLPNLPGATQNFQYVTSLDNNLDNINLRLVHNLGASGSAPRGRFGRQRSNINLGFRYQDSGIGVTNPFPTIGGRTSTRSMDIPAGYVLTRGRLVNNFRVEFNRQRTSTQNLYAFSQNLAALVGVNGVSQDPFDWGLPNLSFTTVTGLNDINPKLERNQTLTISDSIIWSRGRHAWRWGGDFRRIQLNPQTDSNARGSFVFTGINSGYDFADFLLGLPQQTSAQFGTNAYYFRGNSWDAFAQDEWRVAPKLTLNLGVRYEYFSPFSEKYNRIVNLAVAPGFLNVAPVQPGQTSPFGRTVPSTLVNPDRHAFAPRLGLAWRPLQYTVVRAGYGINYNTTAFTRIVQNLAFQPPFSFTQTNVDSVCPGLSLSNGFSCPPAAVTNNFGVDPNYRLGYVQMWNLDIQQQLPRGLVLNLDYTGTKGTDLDMMRAPNRGPAGLLIPGVQPFLWESSEGNSVLHAATVRLRRRFQHGLSFGGTYVFSKSIDNASSIAGGATVVAQNDLNLAAERGLSSFDQRHRLTGDYLWEFPMGTDKRWLSGKGAIPAILGNWQVSGSVTIASGLPLTARVLGNFSDVNRGTNGTLRANATGLPTAIGNPTTGEFFNTTAFALPALGQFGNAGRNTITGPHTLVFNMALSKAIHLGDVRSLDLRGQASNVFNMPQYTGIDTTINSPSYGRVTSVGAMRTIQIVVRFRF